MASGKRETWGRADTELIDDVAYDMAQNRLDVA